MRTVNIEIIFSVEIFLAEFVTEITEPKIEPLSALIPSGPRNFFGSNLTKIGS